MKRRTLLLLAGAVLVTIAAATYFSRPHEIVVDVVSVSRGDVAETVTNTRAGTIKACQRARLAPAMGGQIARLPVKKGDHVRQGQILLEIWNEDLRAQSALAERDLSAARARAEQACVTAKVARREAERAKALLEQKLIAIDAAERAQGEAESNEAACRAANESTRVAEARVGEAHATLERSRLRAPFDGIVAEINGELGEFVTPSPLGVPTPPAVDVVDTSCIYVAAPIDEVDAPRIREGMRARVTLDAFRDRSLPAHVRRVAPYVLDVEKQARTVEIEAEIEHGVQLELLPGYSADVEVILSERHDVLRIPTRALIEGKRVYVLDPDRRRLALREVVTGIGNWEFTEVRSGLEAKDLVVTSIDREGVGDGVRAHASTPTQAAE